MASTDYFIPAVNHISSNTHMMALIYDEMNEAMLGMSNGRIGITTPVSKEDVFDAIKSTGLIRKHGANINNAAAMKIWRKVAFLVAIINMFPINSRLQIGIANGEDWVDITVGSLNIGQSDVSPAIPKNKADAMAMIADLCKPFMSKKEDCAMQAVNAIYKQVASHAHADHRNIAEWPPRGPFINTAVNIMAKRNMLVDKKVVDNGIYGHLAKTK